MFVIFSGEGPTDMGTFDGVNSQVGPMAKMAAQWIERKLGYSVIDSASFTLKEERDLTRKAKSIKPRSKRGKKSPAETKYYYKNARALAMIALDEMTGRDDPAVIAILFRDADGNAEHRRGNWDEKSRSMIVGFEEEQFVGGVPMVPMPKSEAWLLCALRDQYQRCARLENTPGNDRSPNNLKDQLEVVLGEEATRMLLNEKIDDGEIDINRINGMPSMDEFKKRLDEVLDQYIAQQYVAR